MTIRNLIEDWEEKIIKNEKKMDDIYHQFSCGRMSFDSNYFFEQWTELIGLIQKNIVMRQFLLDLKALEMSI